MFWAFSGINRHHNFWEIDHRGQQLYGSMLLGRTNPIDASGYPSLIVRRSTPGRVDFYDVVDKVDRYTPTAGLNAAECKCSEWVQA